MPSSACYGINTALHSFPTRRSSDLDLQPARDSRQAVGSPAVAKGHGDRNHARPAPRRDAIELSNKLSEEIVRMKFLDERSHQCPRPRSEEHTSELQSRRDLVCRLLPATASTQLYTLSLHDALPI